MQGAVVLVWGSHQQLQVLRIGKSQTILLLNFTASTQLVSNLPNETHCCHGL